MTAIFRCLIVCCLALTAVPGFAVEFAINGFEDDFSVDDCSGLTVDIFDALSVIGFRQETYTLYRDGSAIDSKVENMYGIIPNLIINVTFHIPTAAGTYQVKRSGIGHQWSSKINVALAPGLDCDGPMRVTTLGDDMWFEGNDWTHKPVAGDFDQDGRIDDIAYRGKCGTGTECWRVHLGDGTSFTTHNFGGNMWFQGNAPTNAPVAGDFDNDGYFDDIAYWGKCGSSGADCWRVHISNGSSFSTANFGANMWFQGSTPVNAPVVGDFDNDEFVDDLAYWGKCGSGSDCWRVHLSNGSSFTTAGWGADMWFQGNTPSNMPVVGDFDNDGYHDDLVYWGKFGSGGGIEAWRAHLSNGSTFITKVFGFDIWFGGNSIHRMPLAGEIDNDGRLDDVIYFGKCGIGFNNWRHHMSTGNIFNAACALGSTGAWFEGGSPRNAPMIGDFDNDGERDDIVYYGKCGTGTDCWRAHIWP